MEPTKNIPKGLLESLEQKGYTITPRAVAAADMTSDGELRYLYLLLDDEVLYFAVSCVAEPVQFAGSLPRERELTPADITEVYRYDVKDLSHPEVMRQVVGGLLTVKVKGEDTWLCRFTSARMRQMQGFVRALREALGEDEEHGPQGRPGGPHGGRHRPPDDEIACCPKCGMPYPEPGRQICPRCMEKRAIFFRILSCFKAYKGRMAVMLLCIAASSLFNALWPYLSGTVLYDQVLVRDAQAGALTGGDFVMLLGYLTLAMVAVKLLQQLTGILQGRLVGHMVPGVVFQLKTQVFSALQRLSIGFFTRRQTGSLMQRINGDAGEVTGLFIDGIPYLIFNVLTIAAAIVFMFTIEWRLAIVAVLMIPPLFLISYKLLPRFWHANGRRAKVMRSLYSVLNDNLTGARVVRTFGQEQSEDARFDRVNNRVRDAEINVVRYRNRFDATYSVGRDLPMVLVWCVGAVLILSSSGRFTYGQLITFVNYLTMMQGPMIFFSDMFYWWTDCMNAAQRIFEIIDAVPDVAEKPDAVHTQIKGDVTLRDVSFSYDPHKEILHHIDLEVKQGEMLGIVGKSGAGKSTLVNLISRLYDADSGEVLLDGINVKDLAFTSLRGAVAMVSQETYIFMGTIAENIAYARPNATREEIVQAAIAASAHPFICRLPDGYDTVIGRGGRQLSGGERQRLSIARAILTDPRILVLDEATASVDTETERAIQASLDELIKGRTTISIAHRLSTLRGADRLIVIDDGKVVESGTHEELVRQKGEYYKLLQLQSKALAMRGVGD
ncbi:MAG: ABC transporter ATP-binding protein [Acutalibacteraceae bacterium]|jgi:ATP-binding cassette subfamily B protein